MRCLVTGGSGFIGKHLIDHLRSIGHEVVVSFGLLADIRDRQETLEIFLALEPDVVFHLAARASVRDSLVHPWKYVDTNITGTLNVLAASAAVHASHFVFISSGGTVYGKTESLPLKVGDPNVPEDIYGLTKLTGEHLTRIICQQNGMKYYSLRYPNVYGPGQDSKGEAGVVAIFADKMLHSEAPTINGDGRQTRDFMFVGDVVKATADVISHCSGEYNIGTGKGLSVNHIYEALRSVTGYTGKAIHGPAKPGEVRHVALEPSFPMSYTSLLDGLTQTVESFR